MANLCWRVRTGPLDPGLTAPIFDEEAAKRAAEARGGTVEQWYLVQDAPGFVALDSALRSNLCGDERCQAARVEAACLALTGGKTHREYADKITPPAKEPRE